MRRSIGRALAGIFIVGSMIASGCQDQSVDPVLLDQPLSATPVLSDPASLTLTASSIPFSPAIVAGQTEQVVVYISLPPNLAASAERAVITHRASGFSVTELVRDGGLEPVPVPAAEGDEVDLDVYNTTGQKTTFTLPVPAKKKPQVVRTVPARGKTDVPLNSTVRVTFSEPIAPQVVTSGAIRLLRNNAEVSGELAFYDDERLSVAFIPSVPLARNADYRLVVDAAARDLDDDVVGQETSISFRTGTGVEVPGPIASIVVSPDPATVRLGQPVRFTAIAKDANGQIVRDVVPMWESSDPEVADFPSPGGDTVGVNGMALSARPGAVTITARMGSVTGSASLTVLPGPNDPEVVSLTLTPAGTTIGVEDQINVSVMMRNAQGSDITGGRWIDWRSDNVEVATVTQSSACGACLEMRLQIVTGISQGTARIIASSEGFVDTALIVVGPRRQISRIKIVPERVSLVATQTSYLTATPVDAEGREILHRPLTWTNGNPTAVSMTEDGGYYGRTNVRALAAGSATLTATVEGVSATATITVPLLTFKSISAGREANFSNEDQAAHSCGLTMSGEAFCWGSDYLGQLGDVERNGSSGPSKFPVHAQAGMQFSSLVAGAGITCGLEPPAGFLICWGGWGGSVPGDVGGGLTFTSFDIGVGPCALTAEGTSYCLYYGYEPEPLGPVLASLTTGNRHYCGLTPSGDAYCWGANESGQLGDGSTTDRTAPVRVSGAQQFVALAAGDGHSCGLTASGAAYCWGANQTGALGDGTFTNRLVPTPVTGGRVFTMLSVGRSFASTCGVTTAGNGLCWGQNNWGQVGDGTTINRAAPAPIALGLGLSAVSTGGGHACGLTTSGVVYCWGNNTTGAVGSNAANTTMPVKVIGQP